MKASNEGIYRVQYGGPRPKDFPDADRRNEGFTIEVGRTLWFNTKITNFQDPCAGHGDGGGG